jgi:hypothetical protein
MKMASDADEFNEELQRLAHVAKIRNDERIQASGWLYNILAR